MNQGSSTTLPDRAVPGFLKGGIRGQLRCPGQPLGILNCCVPLGLVEPGVFEPFCWRNGAMYFAEASLALLSPRSSDTGTNPQPCAFVCGPLRALPTVPKSRCVMRACARDGSNCSLGSTLRDAGQFGLAFDGWKHLSSPFRLVRMPCLT